MRPALSCTTQPTNTLGPSLGPVDIQQVNVVVNVQLVSAFNGVPSQPLD